MLPPPARRYPDPMRKWLLPLLAVLLGGGFAALIIFGVSSTGTDRSLDQAVAAGKAPMAPGWNQKLPKLSGGKASLSDWQGSVVVLNLWASWCPPCREEGPLLERNQKAIARAGAAIVGVTWNDSSRDALEFAKQAGMTYPELRDVNGSFARAWGTKGLPETFVIDRTGHVQAMNRGEVSQKWLNEHLYPLLPGAKAPR